MEPDGVQVPVLPGGEAFWAPGWWKMQQASPGGPQKDAHMRKHSHGFDDLCHHTIAVHPTSGCAKSRKFRLTGGEGGEDENHEDDTGPFYR